MALVRCPDCGSEVSDKAPACLKCGRPLGSNAGRQGPHGRTEGCFLRGMNVGCIVILVIFAIAVVLAGIGFGDS